MPHVIVADYRGLDANRASELRRKVRAAGGAIRVVKNRLTKRAAEGTAVEQIRERLTGPCALAMHADDPVGLAKTLTEFAKDNPELELLSGVIEARDVLDAKGIEALSALPGLPELRAQLLSVIQAPASKLVRLLATPGSQVARVLDARRESMEEGGA